MAKIMINKNNIIDQIDERLYGSFIEHMGRAVYEGIYEPGHSTSDENGFRGDVKKLCSDLKIPIVRYPGGNFVSGYEWEDGIGPKEERPTRLDLAWQSIETNQFGLHEFMSWTEQIGSEAMMAVNLGTRGITEARNLIEYCNFPSGTYWSDKRIENGQEKPYDIKLWCLGNEMDGPWQIGHKTADEYGRLAEETGKVLKLVDPSIELVVCGSSHRDMPTFGEWERTVLRHTYEDVDYLSLHQYYGNQENNINKYMARAVEMDLFIKEVVAICEEIKAEKNSSKKMMLSFDEWNIWYHTLETDKEQELWQAAPPILQDVYNFEDALVFGSMMITLLKNSDRVKIACLAQLVNVIAPIMTEKDGSAWAQTIYYPFQLVSLFGRGTAIGHHHDVDAYFEEGIGEVPYVDSVSVLNEKEDELTIFYVNRDSDHSRELTIELIDFEIDSLIEIKELAGFDLKEINTKDSQKVQPTKGSYLELTQNSLTLNAKSLSWNMARVKLK